ncbi:hypothetical protein B0T25DRAFT_563356 [Lasiosphaeria hispida]|uniref:Uncharacterized protein n=1 Tax=Lasiosphaeria hispida TaxID=260671 RepID=A0AAJ0HX76_9PEZI|nr:hypothetical protein B0T25DRAFT_563356 [Lasiosphaeria hispida]
MICLGSLPVKSDGDTQVRIPLAALAEALKKACQRQLNSDIDDARKPRKTVPKQKELGELERLKQELRNKDQKLRDQDQKLRDQDQKLRDQGQKLRDQDQELREERMRREQEMRNKDRELRQLRRTG